MNELSRKSVQLEDMVLVYVHYAFRSEFCSGQDCMDLFGEVIDNHTDSIVTLGLG